MDHDREMETQVDLEGSNIDLDPLEGEDEGHLTSIMNNEYIASKTRNLH